MDSNQNNITSDKITKKKGKAGLIIGIVCAVLLIAGIGLFLFFFVSGSDARKEKQKIELADKYLTDLDYDSAILAYREAIAINPKNEKAYIGLAKAYKGAIESSEAEGKIEEALEYADEAIKDLKTGVTNTHSEEVKEALEEIKDKKEELLDKLKESESVEPIDEEKETEIEEVIPDPSEKEETDIPDETIDFFDFGTYDNPALNQYLESLGYIWVGEGGPWGGKGYWTMSKDYGATYSIYLGESGYSNDPNNPLTLNLITGMESGPQFYYWTEGAYDSATFLRAAEKHAEMFHEFQKHFDEVGVVVDQNGNYADGFYIVNEEYRKLRDEFWDYCSSL